jgi:hypothetical protein
VIEALALAAACGRVVARVPFRPPAPIVARTGCGTFVIGTNGSVRRRRSSSAPFWAPGAASHPAPNTWVAHPHGHLAVYRAGKLLWRSHVRHGTDNVAIAGNTIAFSVWGPRTPESLWISHVGGRERRLGPREEPIAWTANGLLTQRGSEIRVRSRSGRLIRVAALGHGPVYDAADHTVLLVGRRGALLRTDGRTVWRLATGFKSTAWVQLLEGRVIDVTTGRKSVFLRANGSSLGVTAPLDEPAAVMGGVVALPNGNGIVYVVNRGRKGRNPGTNLVYVSRPNSSPRLLYARRVPRLSCGEWAGLSYNAGRVLYVDDEGPMALLDPSGRTPPVDVTPALRILQPRKAAFAQLTADWLSKWR